MARLKSELEYKPLPAAIPVPNPDETRLDATAETEKLPEPRETYWGPRVEPVPHFKKAKFAKYCKTCDKVHG